MYIINSKLLSKSHSKSGKKKKYLYYHIHVLYQEKVTISGVDKY